MDRGEPGATVELSITTSPRSNKAETVARRILVTGPAAATQIMSRLRIAQIFEVHRNRLGPSYADEEDH